MINLNPEHRTPLYEQLYKQFKEQIQTGRIRAGDKMPSRRKLAEELGISVNTVDNAYAQLVLEGYIQAQERRGFRVLEFYGLLHDSAESVQVNNQVAVESKYQVDFSPTDTDLYSFPFTTWRRLLKSSFDADDINLLKRAPTQGNEALRIQLCDYLYRSRGVNCSPEQIIIGAGTDALLQMLTMILEREDGIAVENPLHSNTYKIFAAAGYRVQPVSVGDQGMNISELNSANVAAVYITPSNQFPLGVSMPIGRRSELLRWATRNGPKYIIEDDYDSEFRYHSKPIPSLQGMDKHGCVIYLGTFSKSVAPSLRVSYMVLPERLLPLYKERCAYLGSAVSAFEQRLLSEFMSKGYFEKHLNRMRKIYKTKRELMLDELDKFKCDIQVLGEAAGQHLLVRVALKDARHLSELAKTAGVKIYPLDSYYIGQLPDKYKQCLLLGYGGLTEKEIICGIILLKNAWRQ